MSKVNTEQFIPIITINNRSAKRKVEFEIERNTPKLRDVEDRFIADLFDNPEMKHYESLFLVYQDEYKMVLDYLQGKNAFKYTRPNRNYFKETYGPIEFYKPKTDKMLQLLRFLIFGTRCKHQWELAEKLTPFDNDHQSLYICKECGKMKKVNLKVQNVID